MSDNHPIEALMETAMENLKMMVDVNTILGEPVETSDGSVILPVSRVSFGFAAGGTEFSSDSESEASFPFGGGSGGGISLNPVAFLVVGNQQVRLLPVDNSAIYDRIIDLIPKVIEQYQGTRRGTTNGVVKQNAFDLGPMRT